uniref:2Fe-2S ferredoxin-type domain-containing protein n=1 Tax=Oncorhynchus tshawytscha TaxID=74940 RepID=A0A8C8JAX1_ONCTS
RYFINRDRQKITTSCAKGNSFLDRVVDQNIYIDGFGACEGTLACSTCHVILDQKGYDQLGPIIDEENDMLDLAFGLTHVSSELPGLPIQRSGVSNSPFARRGERHRRSDDAGPTL